MRRADGFISDPVTMQDIRHTTGEPAKDVIANCLSAKINPFSKFKPVAVVGFEQPSDVLLATNRYGLRAVATANKNALYSMSLAWQYDRPQAPYFRQHDFYRYFHSAPCPFMQANGQRLDVDLVNISTAPALFYMLMNDGKLANLAFDPASGIAAHEAAVADNRLPYCIAVEDLGFDSGGGTFHSVMGGTLGLVIFSTAGAYVDEIWASTAVAHLSTRENTMFNIPLSSLSLPMGDYTAVACCKVNDGGLTYYLPVYDDAAYPARFLLSVGGLDLYRQAAFAVGENALPSTVTRLQTTALNVYVTMRFWNYSGRVLTILGGANSKFTLVTRLQGNIVVQGTAVSYDRSVSSAVIANPAEGSIEVPDRGYADLVFKVPNIWSADGTSSAVFVESGEVTLTPRLYYMGSTEYTGSYHRPLVVEYGN